VLVQSQRFGALPSPTFFFIIIDMLAEDGPLPPPHAHRGGNGRFVVLVHQSYTSASFLQHIFANNQEIY
jgi:hypothetical protein